MFLVSGLCLFSTSGAIIGGIMKRIKIEYPIQASFTVKRSESEARVRVDRVEGRSESRKEKREVKKAAKHKEA